MKGPLLLLTVALICNWMACHPDKQEETTALPSYPVAPDPEIPENTDKEEMKIKLIIGSATFTAIVENNATAATFKELLPLTLYMSELNQNEKYHNLSHSLPTTATRVGTIHTGDLMLWGDNCLVLFYKTFPTSYSYTRLGAVDNPDGLEAALGAGNVTVTFEQD
ncbi:MAG: hypothetical protein LIP08_15870 [Bacteroides sp.]|nr:hypothetical protein [Bacteroides sp.]